MQMSSKLNWCEIAWFSKNDNDYYLSHGVVVMLEAERPGVDRSVGQRANRRYLNIILTNALNMVATHQSSHRRADSIMTHDSLQ